MTGSNACHEVFDNAYSAIRCRRGCGWIRRALSSKGIPYGIEALGTLNREVPLELTLISDAGPERDERGQRRFILSTLRRTGLDQKTRLLGYQPHATMLTEAQAHHLFLHPSVTANDRDTEGGSPVCVTQRLPSGMPVVATSHCEIPEVMGPAMQHLVAPERSVDGLLDRLRALLAEPVQRDALARAGRGRVPVATGSRIGCTKTTLH